MKSDFLFGVPFMLITFQVNVSPGSPEKSVM